MSATNSTPNYGLPQYVADDKPTYLGDFNKAMLDIDTNMKSIDNKAEGAESGIASVQATANQALENANTANTKATTAQSTAEQAQTSATNAQSTATEAKKLANTVNTNLTNLSDKVNNLDNDIGEWIQIDALDSSLNRNNSILKASINKKCKLLSIYGAINNINKRGPLKIGNISALPITLLKSANIYFGGMYKEQNIDATVAERIDILQNGDIMFPNFNTTGNIEYDRINTIIQLSDTTTWQIN